MNINKVLVVGRVTKDVELKNTTDGTAVARITVATSRTWKNRDGGKEEESEFHNVVAWGKTAEIASQFLTKGALVGIEGRLRTRQWDDKNGVTRYTTEIYCEKLQLGPKPNGAASSVSPKVGQYQAQSAVGTSDEAGQAGEIPLINVDEDSVSPDDLPF